MPRLFAELERFSDNLALVTSQGEAYSYADLLELADRQAARLGRGPTLVAIESHNRVEAIAAYVGAIRAGHVVLPIAPGSLGPESLIRKIYGPTHLFRAVDGEWRLEETGRAAPPILHPDLAVLLSTSGSTGNPKLVRLSHANLLANAAAISEYLGLSATERACTTLPWSYSYGLSVLHTHLQSGAALLLTEDSVTEARFWSFFKRYQATSFAGVPYTFELLEKMDFLDQALPALRYFTQAGGQLGPDKVSRFAAYADKHGKRFFVMYGQTEAAPRMAYLPPATVRLYPDCIGQAVPGGQFRLEDEQGREIDRVDEAGELIYSGPNVMMGYALTASDLAKGSELTELRTGDIAMRNRAGFYRIVGRASRFSKIFGLRLNLDDLQHFLTEQGHVNVVAGDDQGVVVAIKVADQVDRVRQLVGRRFNLPTATIAVWVTGEFPRLASGKTDYMRILRAGRLAAEKLSAARASADIGREIGAILGQPGRSELSFVELGGDSLNYVHAAMLLEERLGYSPKGWEYMPLRELQALRPKAASWRQSIELDIFIRALAITLIVIHHVTRLPMGGAAIILLILAGYNFGRFQVPKLNAGASFPVLKPVFTLVLPLYFVALTLYFIAKGTVFPPQYLLYSNFTAGLHIAGERVLTTWWFIETYVWLLVLFTGLLQFPGPRRLSKNQPWLFSLLMLAATALVHGVGEFFPACNLFFRQAPLMTAYLFVAGWALFLSKTKMQRLVATVLFIGILYLFPPQGGVLGYATYTWQTYVPAVVLLNWAPALPIDKWSGRVLTRISLASLQIYITHGLLIHPARQVAGGEIPPRLWVPVIAGCLLVGIFTWELMNRIRPRPAAGSVGSDEVCPPRA